MLKVGRLLEPKVENPPESGHAHCFTGYNSSPMSSNQKAPFRKQDVRNVNNTQSTIVGLVV